MYESIGLHARSLGSYLPDLCTFLRSHGGSSGWEARIYAALVGKDNFHPKKALSELKMQDFTLLQGSKDYPAGSPQMKKLLHFVMLVLFEMGILDRRPVAIYYRKNHELTLDEILDRMVAAKFVFPVVSEIGGRTPEWASFVALLPNVIKRILYVNRNRAMYADHLRTWTQKIGHDIANGEAPSDHARSLFLALAPQGKRAFRSVEWDDSTYAPKATVRTSLPLANCADPLVKETFDLLVATTNAGPASRYLKLISKRSGNTSIYWYGPMARTLTIAVGYHESVGPFSSYDMEPVAQLPWSAQSQLDAIVEREAEVFARTDRDPFIIVPPVMSDSIGDQPAQTSIDEPGFTLSFIPEPVAGKVPDCSQFDVDYTFELTERVCSTSVGTFLGPQMLILDRVMKGGDLGGGELSPHDLSDFALIDIELSEGLDIRASSNAKSETNGVGPAVIPGGLQKEDIFYTLPGKSEVFVTELDFSSHYYRNGSLLFLPGLREFVLPPRSWAYAEDGVILGFVKSRIGLREDEIRESAESIRVSHNVAKMAVFLPTENLPPVSPAVVAHSHLSHF